MKKKIVLEIPKAWEVKKKVKRPKVRMTDKQLLARRVKKKKFADVKRMIEIIGRENLPEFLLLLGGGRLKASEIENIMYEIIALEDMAKGKSVKECFVEGQLSPSTLDRVHADFLENNPSFRKK